MPSSYWEERAKQEKAWQLKQLENDAEFGKLLETYYNQAIEDINDSIEKELNRVGKDQVTQMDVKTYETKAKSIVAEAEKMRANGQKVTYADFSDQVNQRLKVYNATMRINRLEHLKSEVGLDMLRASVKVDSSLRDKLSGDYQKEVIRQAGIMMDSAQRSPWTGKDAAKILMAQTNGATFSQRLWADQDALKAKLDQVLSVGMIQGQNPRKMATRLREQVKTAVGNQRYVTERLARTESARIQTNVQLESIKSTAITMFNGLPNRKRALLVEQLQVVIVGTAKVSTKSLKCQRFQILPTQIVVAAYLKRGLMAEMITLSVANVQRRLKRLLAQRKFSCG
ncbi:phage head morphogenesis protein [Limosilactobacillus mucosae]|uniref:phage head morphogenesis protein n=1 Tax=Limosilactobacillus mucosae TaxID=97478 RepID=UPI0030B91857